MNTPVVSSCSSLGALPQEHEYVPDLKRAIATAQSAVFRVMQKRCILDKPDLISPDPRYLLARPNFQTTGCIEREVQRLVGDSFSGVEREGREEKSLEALYKRIERIVLSILEEKGLPGSPFEKSFYARSSFNRQIVALREMSIKRLLDIQRVNLNVFFDSLLKQNICVLEAHILFQDIVSRINVVSQRTFPVWLFAPDQISSLIKKNMKEIILIRREQLSEFVNHLACVTIQMLPSESRKNAHPDLIAKEPFIVELVGREFCDCKPEAGKILLLFRQSCQKVCQAFEDAQERHDLSLIAENQIFPHSVTPALFSSRFEKNGIRFMVNRYFQSGGKVNLFRCAASIFSLRGESPGTRADMEREIVFEIVRFKVLGLLNLLRNPVGQDLPNNEATFLFPDKEKDKFRTFCYMCYRDILCDFEEAIGTFVPRELERFVARSAHELFNESIREYYSSLGKR